MKHGLQKVICCLCVSRCGEFHSVMMCAEQQSLCSFPLHTVRTIEGCQCMRSRMAQAQATMGFDMVRSFKIRLNLNSYAGLRTGLVVFAPFVRPSVALDGKGRQGPRAMQTGAGEGPLAAFASRARGPQWTLPSSRKQGFCSLPEAPGPGHYAVERAYKALRSGRYRESSFPKV
ncbi:hypothetical protein AK812_SmicGene26689 [Symbiodinium microadriaticum]|uniref:Uncharacterized protein n=1 Tax=Symbiodinium microadriaticum TaxID=2951 RepID=A0A1Q9D8W5_SYMMI|nr:hypothetical protein AK812_SmicGene26689 [Symbiodinium microadriaticum]